jgi:opacity protein-like surface antigen
LFFKIGAEMKKLSSLVAVAVMCFSASNAYADGGKFYVAGGIGMAVPHDVGGTIPGVDIVLKYDNAATVGGAIGYKANQNIRIEGQIAYISMGLDSISGNGVIVNLDGDLDVTTYTVAAYYDFKKKSRFTPYVGAGAGWVHWSTGSVTASLNGTSVTITDTSGNDFTAFGEAGVSMSISDNLEIGPSYRYQYSDTGTAGVDDSASSVVTLGLRYTF